MERSAAVNMMVPGDQRPTAALVGALEPSDRTSSGRPRKIRTVYNDAQKLLLETSLRAMSPNRPARQRQFCQPKRAGRPVAVLQLRLGWTSRTGQKPSGCPT